MNCIIIDDEFPSREELKYFIKTFSKIAILEEFDNGIKALKYIKNNTPDIIFLDINMPDIDGIELAKILYKMNYELKIIFITAYKEYAIDAFDVHAFDYLLKPYSKQRIISALQRLESTEKLTIENKIDKISVIKEDKIYVIDIKSIYYIEANGRGVRLYTSNNQYYSKNKISELEDRFLSKEFYKCHRSYIVNLEKIAEIKPWFNATYVLKLKNIDKDIPVSRNNVKTFKEILGLK